MLLQLAANLHHLVNHLFTRLQPLTAVAQGPSSDSSKPLITLPTTCPESPIFAILSSHPRALATYCQAAGFIVRPVVAPTVPSGTERVRVCLHSGNTVEQIDRFVACVRRWVVDVKTGATTLEAGPTSRPDEIHPKQQPSERQLHAKI